jgi:hypothetical protein
MCVYETYNREQVGKHLSDTFPTNNGLKQKVFVAIVFQLFLEYAIRMVQANQDGLKLNGTHELLVYADDVILLKPSGNLTYRLVQY